MKELESARERTTMMTIRTEPQEWEEQSGRVEKHRAEVDAKLRIYLVA
jgi:hypothetical protein